MEEDKKFTFEDVFKQNERRIHYHIHRLGIRDPHQEFFVEGIYALWMAYKKYEPDKGPMSTYFNFTIRNRLVDMIRKEENERKKFMRVIEESRMEWDSGNRNAGLNQPIVRGCDEELEMKELLRELLDKLPTFLTTNELKWVQGFCIEGLSVKELAEREGVTENAVKSWGRQTRIKLRNRRKGMGFMS